MTHPIFSMDRRKVVWHKWCWWVVRNVLDWDVSDKIIEEGVISSPSLKNARMRALQASSESQSWWHGNWSETTVGHIMQPKTVEKIQVYKDYEVKNQLLLKALD